MGKAEYQPQPFTEAKRRGVATTVGGTANLLKIVITNNVDDFIRELREPNMAGYKEEQVLLDARNHLAKAYKRLRQLEKMLDDRAE